MDRRLITFLLAVFLSTASWAQAQSPPYPSSTVIDSISWDCGGEVRGATGSDLWVTTWHDDGHLYTVWGDGFCGFAECGDKSSIGITRLKGTPTTLNTEEWICDVAGTCTNSPVSAGSTPDSWSNNDGGGKIDAIVSINGTMYAWVNLQNAPNPDFDIQLYKSTNDGVNWSATSVVFGNGSGNFKPNSFLNFGQSNAGARDGFVYFYGYNEFLPYSDGDTPNIYMGRVSLANIENKGSYEYFTGTASSPTWSTNIGNRVPVFTDNAGMPNHFKVIYNPGINRYMLLVTHTDSGQSPGNDRDLGVFDAPEPWGPWTTAYYTTSSWCGQTGNLRLSFNVPTKTPDWLSSDGRTFHVLWSAAGGGSFDQYRQVKGTIALPSESGVLYASPGGSGTACTQSSPCSRSTGMNQVQAGETLRLLNGNYIGIFSTVKSGSSGNPITIEAANKWGARFSLNTTCGSSTGNLTNINHSNLIIRGIDFDFCRFAGSNGGVRIGTSSAISNVTFEHNRVRDTQASGIHYSAGANNLIIRHNRIEDTGHRQHWGECNYVSNANAVQIYGNTFHGCTENGVDIKGSSFNIDIHHNIFEDQIPADEQSPGLGCGGCSGTRGTRTHGTIRAENGLNSDIHDNIGRNNDVGSFGHASCTKDRQNIKYHNNVLYDTITTDSSTLSQCQSGGTSVRNEFNNNTACNLQNYGFGGGGNWNAHDNDLNVSQSLCDAEESRILNEMANLPGVQYGDEPSVENPEISKAYALRTVPNTIFVELSDPSGGISVDPATGFSATVEASPVTISTASCVSTVASVAVCTLTHDGTVDASSDAILVSYDQGTGNVLDGGGEELAAFTDVSATNWYDKVWNTDVVIAHTPPSGSPVSALFDDDFTTETSSVFVDPGPTMFVEFDTVNPVTLSSSIVAGDASGNFTCLTYDLETKMNAGDAYTLVVNNQDCNQRQLVTRSFAPTEGRFWKFTFTGPTAGVQVMEIDGELTPDEFFQFGPFVEACHTTAMHPGATVLDALDSWESTLNGASGGAVFLLDSQGGTFATSTQLEWSDIEVYAHDCDPTVVDPDLPIELGSDTVVAGIDFPFADSTGGFVIDDAAVVAEPLISNVVLRNNRIYGGTSDHLIRIQSNAQNITIQGNDVNGGGANGAGIAIIGDGLATLDCAGEEPDNITVVGNKGIKDHTTIPGWIPGNFTDTEPQILIAAAGNVTVERNQFMIHPSVGKELAVQKYNCNAAATVWERNYFSGEGFESDSRPCLRVQGETGATGMVTRAALLGNLFDGCNVDGIDKQAIVFGATDDDVIEGGGWYNVFKMEGDNNPAVIFKDTASTFDWRHNTIVDGGIQFASGGNPAQATAFDEFEDNIVFSAFWTGSTNAEMTSCSHNANSASSGSLPSECTNTIATFPGFPLFITCGTTANCDFTPTDATFLSEVGSDGTARVANVPPILNTATVDDDAPNRIDIGFSLHAASNLGIGNWSWDAGPISAVNINQITCNGQFQHVCVAGSPRQIIQSVINGGTEVQLTLSSNVGVGQAITFDASYGWCQESAEIGGIPLNSRCLGVSGQVVQNNLTTDPEPEPGNIGVGMVAYWPLDNTLADLMSNAPLTFVGGTVTYDVNGQLEAALQFDGNVYATTGMHSIAGVSLFPTAGNPFSVSKWFKTTATGTVVASAVDAQDDRDYQEAINAAGDASIYFAGAQNQISGVFNDGTWHHLVVTWDGTIGKIYLDNVLVQAAMTVGTSPEDTAEPILLGARTGGTAFRLTGSIDEVRIYNRALVDDDVTALFEFQGDSTPPSAPFDLQITPFSQTRLDLDWLLSEDEGGIRRYEIEMCEGSLCVNFAPLDTTVSTSYSALGLSPGTDYRFRVRAEDLFGNLSDYSDIVKGTTLADVSKSFFIRGGTIRGGTFR